MTDDRLTPEERALIDAAVASYDLRGGSHALGAAVDAYKASVTPQPVECLMTRWPDDIHRGGWCTAYPLGESLVNVEVWRVTITPIERVR